MKTYKFLAQFTLIELLVVISIISVLASLLLPALNRAMGTAKMTHCSNNLKNVGIAMMVYANDHNDALPKTSGYTPSDPVWTGTERRWTGIINPYIEAGYTNQWRLPADMRCKEDESNNAYWYGMNTRYTGKVFKKSASGLSNTIMIGDANSFFFYPNRWTKNYKFRHLDTQDNGTGILNTLHGDLHAESYHFSEGKLYTPHEQCWVLNPNKWN